MSGARVGCISNFELEQLAYKLYTTLRPFARQAPNLAHPNSYDSGSRPVVARTRFITDTFQPDFGSG